MLWVEINLRRESSIVWREGGFDAPALKLLAMRFWRQDLIAKNFKGTSKRKGEL